MKASDNRFYVKFMQLEIGLLFVKCCCIIYFEHRSDVINIVKLFMDNSSQRGVLFINLLAML